VRFNTEGLFIKVSGVTSEQDALFCIGLGATAVGFEFGPTPRRISPTDAHDIVRRLPPGSLSIGVFHHEMPQRIVEIVNTLGLSGVQIEGPMTRTSLTYVAERVNTVIRSLPTGSEVLNSDPLEGVDYFLLPESDDINALNACLEVFQDTTIRTPLIASGGLDSSNVVEVVQNYPVWGVDVRAGVEVGPGVKDPVLLGEFISNARWAFDNAYVAHRHDEWPTG
jgi:phosphoribosylanthranilate isomerase